ncbi:MAG: hypothetical protein HY819_21825 [Acidobacteria bacterium]|nr:hypothetical protein [Acidobacteriota bacterium]
MFKLKVFFLVCFLFSSITQISFSQSNKPLSPNNQTNQTTNQTTKNLPPALVSYINQPPLGQEEILNRVKAARTSNQDFDDIASDVDQRGINFVPTDQLFNQLRFLRASIVNNALSRADERRKALMTKPKSLENTTLETLPEETKKELKALPFIEQARAIAKAYVSSLPNFIVRQQVQRYGRPLIEGWKLGDYLELAVSYSVDRGEEIKLRLKNGRTANTTFEEVGGLTSTGQFAGQLSAIFSPDSKTEFVEKGNVDFYGQPCLVFDYKVETRNSRQQIKIGGAQAITGYRGRLYIHQESKQVLRMEQEAIEIPYSFPILDATSVVDFGWVTIGTQEYLLPVNAQVSLTSREDRFTALNCISFNKYNKFDTDVKLLD